MLRAWWIVAALLPLACAVLREEEVPAAPDGGEPSRHDGGSGSDAAVDLGVDGPPVDLCPPQREGACAARDNVICDPVCQTGCPEGFRCAWRGSGQLGCVPDEPAHAICEVGCSTVLDDCAAGSRCDTDEGVYSCHRYCWADEDCPAGEFCKLKDASFASDLGVCFGFDACTPIDGSGCDGAYGCYAVTAVDCMHVEPQCLPAGGNVDGGPCTFDTNCAPGFTCVTSQPPACRHACDPSGDGWGQPCPFAGGSGTCQNIGANCGAGTFTFDGFGACYP